jgi:hypothetical protein
MNSTMGVNMKGEDTQKAQMGRRYFYLREEVDSVIRYIELGILIALPIVVAVFSKKYAAAIVVTEILSCYFGTLICDFDKWWNSRVYDEGRNELLITLPPPNTELETILARLKYFEDVYAVTLGKIYIYLDADIVPFKNNLDWIEMVSLLNQLSLYVGKRFEDEDGNKEEKEC